MVGKWGRIWKIAASVKSSVLAEYLREENEENVKTHHAAVRQFSAGYFPNDIPECYCYTICSACWSQ
jgi:hypothetical protein